jgi:hypothetical protein
MHERIRYLHTTDSWIAVFIQGLVIRRGELAINIGQTYRWGAPEGNALSACQYILQQDQVVRTWNNSALNSSQNKTAKTNLVLGILSDNQTYNDGG